MREIEAAAERVAQFVVQRHAHVTQHHAAQPGAVQRIRARGNVLGNVGMALHHKLCHTLGGSFNLPHAEVHTVVLPHAIAFNAGAAPEAMLRIRRALGVTGSLSAAAALFDLARDNGAPVALKDIGMQEVDLERAAGLVVANPYWNPREIGSGQQGAILRLLRNAFVGQPPE